MARKQGPSRTARVVALARAVGVSDLSDPLVADLLPRPDAAVANLGRRMTSSRLLGRPVRWLVGGGIDHAALRMAAIDGVVTDAVAEGCEQVVLLGAGFDTRAWRLQVLAGTDVFEVDLPATQEVKCDRLSGHEPTAASVTFVPADLAEEDLAEVLQSAGHGPDRATVWLWEGVAMYLPRAAVEASLHAIGGRSVTGSRLVMTFLARQLLPSAAASRVVTPAARAAFGTLGEPLKTSLTDDELTRLASSAGFEVTEITSSDDWAVTAGVRRAPDLFAGERLAVAVRR